MVKLEKMVKSNFIEISYLDVKYVVSTGCHRNKHAKKHRE
jgi:hypothetical protein